MACGVHLGNVFICLVLAEHVCCLWATQAYSSQRQNSRDFSQQNSGQGGYTQNQLRQSNTEATFSRGSGHRISSVGYKLVRSSSSPKPNWGLKETNAQKVSKGTLDLSANIVGSSSFSQHNRNQNYYTGITRKFPVLLSPLSKKETTAERSHSAAVVTPSSGGQRLHSPKESFPSSAVPSNSVQTQTSATVQGRRVSPHRRTKPHFSNFLNEARELHHSKQASSHQWHAQSLPVYGQNSYINLQPHGLEKPTRQVLSYKPGSTGGNSVQTSWDGRNPTKGAYYPPADGDYGNGTAVQLFAPTKMYSIPEHLGGFAIRRLAEPADRKEVGVTKLQQAFVGPSLQASTGPLQQAFVGPSLQAFVGPSLQASTGPLQQVYAGPSLQDYTSHKDSSRQTYTVPLQKDVIIKPQVQKVHPEAKWKRFRPASSLKVRPEDVRG
ncbi:uncharacterized protein [Antennarius striatus]|uniref:uncharacterized protein n=1 Tax=Antennarius striatus TaxID=241820 RepID=UPI0035AEF3F2